MKVGSCHEHDGCEFVINIPMCVCVCVKKKELLGRGRVGWNAPTIYILIDE